MLPRHLRRWLQWLLTFCTICVLYSYLSSRDVGEQDFHQSELEVAERFRSREQLWARDEGKTCEERSNFVYVKMIKCASQTLTSVFRRFGYMRNLSFVTPLSSKLYLCWPYDLETGCYRQATHYNILCEHARYNRKVLEALMPRDTIYITSLREPYSQFKSMINYYNVLNISRVRDQKDPITHYLNNLAEYEQRYKSHEAAKTRYCIPDGFSMTKNLMSFNLGFPTGSFDGAPDLSTDDDYIKSWLHSLEGQLDLVLITEYLPESLVLLRRLMCWNTQDILYRSSNVGRYHYRHEPQEASNRAIYRDWSRVDHLLYEHFNRTLWSKLASQDQDFWDEVRQFKFMLADVSSYCEEVGGAASRQDSSHGEAPTLKVGASPWSEPFTVTQHTCGVLVNDFMGKVKEAYDKRYPGGSSQDPPYSYC